MEDATRERGYRLVGDVDYEACAAVASVITPVPGGGTHDHYYVAL